MTYEVIISEPAEAEASEAFLWPNRVSPGFAKRWYSGLLDAIDSLNTFPKRCPLAPENESFPDVEVRHLIYRQGKTVYRIVFCIFEPDAVRVLHIRHAAREYGGAQTD